MPYKDPEVRRAHQREYNRLRWVERRAANYEGRRRRDRASRDRARAWLTAVKLGAGCQRCGFREHAAALDFHHPGRKDAEVWRLVRDRRSADIEAEVARCVVLCANCHRILHATERDESGAGA